MSVGTSVSSLAKLKQRGSGFGNEASPPWQRGPVLKKGLDRESSYNEKTARPPHHLH
jgi:hypothetical protein